MLKLVACIQFFIDTTLYVIVASGLVRYEVTIFFECVTLIPFRMVIYLWTVPIGAIHPPSVQIVCLERGCCIICVLLFELMFIDAVFGASII